jgi:chemotaxis signal transduction protein
MNSRANVTMVRFTSGGTAYCVPVETALAVRTVTELVEVPDPEPPLVGVLPGSPPLPVIAPLHEQGRQVLVMQWQDRTFGLLVDEVAGVETVPGERIEPAPFNHARALVAGMLQTEHGLVMVADPAGLAGRL